MGLICICFTLNVFIGNERWVNAKCPRCGAVRKLSPYGGYFRYLISFEEEDVVECRIWVLRFEHDSCESTHALLPDILIPYSSYSIRFKLTVLTDYFKRETTVKVMCERFRIAVSTLYAWKDCLLKHKELLLGLLMSQKTSATAFLSSLFDFEYPSDRFECFFQRYDFSFLQNRSMPAAHYHPP